MGRLFALADLHLSLAGDKPMDVFGELWRDHPTRMAQAWDARVGAGDTVLLPGDLSWGRNLEEAAPDLAWIEARPGSKILLKGNHDGWWTSPSQVRRALPPSCQVLYNGALQLPMCVVVGSRGWLAPDDPLAGPQDAKIFRRELQRLRLSIEDADRRLDPRLPRLALAHYPPWIAGRAPTEVVSVLEQAGVRSVVYGHLHGTDHVLAVRGERRGIQFHFVAADAVGFTPVEIAPPAAR